LPLPAGAETTVTRAGTASCSNSLGRGTTPPAPGAATSPATAPGRTTDPMASIIAPHQADLGDAEAPVYLGEPEGAQFGAQLLARSCFGFSAGLSSTG
jgi:hypothetical protein